MNRERVIVQPLPAQKPRPAVEHIAIGMFDGFHLGHQAVIGHMLDAAQDRQKTAAVTFEPHPLAVIAPDRVPPRLTTPEQREKLLRAAGVAEVVVLAFDAATRDLSPEAFIAGLRRIFPALRSITIGHDWSFGKNRKGNAALLETLGKHDNFAVNEVGPVDYQGQPVSSTRIRKAIDQRDFELAAKLLGRGYAFEGRVGKGAGRGKEIGFPTANLVDISQMLPPGGVYVCRAKIEGEKKSPLHLAALNIGNRPTFGVSGGTTVEVHLIEFKGDLRSKTIELSGVKFLREEKKFSSADELKTQIEKDIIAARAQN